MPKVGTNKIKPINIQGTDKADTFNISQEGKKLHVDVNGKRQSFNIKKLQKKGLKIEGLSGDDRYKVGKGVNVPLSINDNSGNNRALLQGDGTTFNGRGAIKSEGDLNTINAEGPVALKNEGDLLDFDGSAGGPNKIQSRGDLNNFKVGPQDRFDVRGFGDRLSSDLSSKLSKKPGKRPGKKPGMQNKQLGQLIQGLQKLLSLAGFNPNSSVQSPKGWNNMGQIDPGGLWPQGQQARALESLSLKASGWTDGKSASWNLDLTAKRFMSGNVR